MNEPKIAVRARGPAPTRQVVTLRVPPDVHTQLKAYSVLADTTVNDVVLKLIEDFLANGGRAHLKERIDALTQPAEQDALRVAEEG